MRKPIVITGLAVSVFLFMPLPALAQLGAPNDGGISIGHIHFLVKDPEAHKKIWVEALGAVPTKTGTLEMLRMPGIFVLFTRGEPTGGSVGSTVNHLGLSVKNLAETSARLEAVNVKVSGVFADLPDGVRLELLEEKSQTLAVVSHHIHMNMPNGEVLRKWYVETFGAGIGSRRNLPSAMFNGGQVDFLPSQMPTAATKGRAIDHIGFEVKNLETFVKTLQAKGVTFDAPYRDVPNIGLKIAFILDPIGTRIELTEGLAGK
jgi:catechol 2,3-dioxygenase-like lactoylglutathione lyase family enzyme